MDRITAVSGTLRRSAAKRPGDHDGHDPSRLEFEKKKLLVRKVFEALPEGGAFIAIESLIDDARRRNTFGLFMSLMMLIEFGDAFDFSAAEFRDWCREAGFSRLKTIPLDGPSSAAVADKDSH